MPTLRRMRQGHKESKAFGEKGTSRHKVPLDARPCRGKVCQDTLYSVPTSSKLLQDTKWSVPTSRKALRHTKCPLRTSKKSAGGHRVPPAHTERSASRQKSAPGPQTKCSKHKVPLAHVEKSASGRKVPRAQCTSEKSNVGKKAMSEKKQDDTEWLPSHAGK